MDGVLIFMSDFSIESYEKKLLKFQEEHPYDCIPSLAVDWFSKENLEIYKNLMNKYPYNDSLEAYKREHANQTPEEAELEFTLIYPEWSILIKENQYITSLDNIDDIDPIMNDRAIPFMDFMEIVEVVFTINDNYLESHINQLLEDENIILPPFLLRYTYDKFPDKKEKLDNLVSKYESGNLISDNALKFVRGQAETHKPMEKNLLLFQTFEFTCQHMEYEAILNETYINTE